MDYITVKEAAEKWKISERMVRKYCEQGKIEGVIHAGSVWILPMDAAQPNEVSSKKVKVEVIMSKKDKALKEFRESLDPNMDEMEKFFLIEEFKHKRDEDTIQAMCYDRVDGDERRLAFLETLLVAIQTDKEDWQTKSEDILWALGTNNAERLLIGLCGWGANSLAKLARIVPCEEADLISCDDSATLIVRWNDGKISTSECSINPFTFEVEEFEDEVFTPHAYDSEVEAVFVEVKLELSDSKYCFACITEEERERTSDEFSYWYSLKRDNDD